MPKSLIAALSAGLCSAGLFLVIFALGLGTLFTFLPAIPLFYIGLSRYSRRKDAALATATLTVSLVGTPAAGILYLGFLGLPAWILTKRSLRVQRGNQGSLRWYPLGLAMVDLSVYATLCTALMVLFYADAPGGLPGMIETYVREAFAEADAEYAEVVEVLAGSWSFLIFPVTAWLWAMALYAHAWLINRLLVTTKEALRPNFRITEFAMPGWVLQLLAISALASLIGGVSMSFLGKASFLTLLLPYFFLGAAWMHRAASTWPNARFFLFFVYLLVFTQFWPALFLCGMGLYRQLFPVKPQEKL